VCAFRVGRIDAFDAEGYPVVLAVALPIRALRKSRFLGRPAHLSGVGL